MDQAATNEMAILRDRLKRAEDRSRVLEQQLEREREATRQAEVRVEVAEEALGEISETVARARRDSIVRASSTKPPVSMERLAATAAN